MERNTNLKVTLSDFDNETRMNLIKEFEAICNQHKVNKNQYYFTPEEAAKMLNMTLELLQEMIIFEDIIINKIVLENGEEVTKYLKSQLCRIYVNQQLRKLYV